MIFLGVKNLVLMESMESLVIRNVDAKMEEPANLQRGCAIVHQDGRLVGASLRKKLCLE